MKIIMIIFADEDIDIAIKIKNYLLAKETELIEANNRLFRFKTETNTYTDSAIVILSDEAVENDSWQKLVRTIPESFRVIPVGNTVDADYSDPNVIPPKIEEINSIRIDEALMDNIFESLITNPEIYNIKSDLIAMMNSYYSSGLNKDFLITDRKMINNYQKMISDAAKREKKESLKMQFNNILRYLAISKSYADKIFREDVVRYIKHGLMVILAFVVVIVAFNVQAVLKRATNNSLLMTVDMDSQMASFRAIEAVEALTNPFFPDESKSIMYNLLVDALDENWENTPLGVRNYKWARNDVAYAGDEDHLFTAEGDGKVAKWDVTTGRPIQKEQVSENPLGAIAVSEDNKIRVAIDSEGMLYYSLEQNSWISAEYKCEIAWKDTMRLKLSKDNQKLMVFDDTTFILLGFNNGNINELYKKNFDEIGDGDFDKNGVSHILVKSNDVGEIIEIRDNGTEKTISTDITVNSICSPDICEETAAIIDQNGQVFVMDVTKADEKKSTGLVLSNPIALALSNKGYLLYLDRNAGVRIYDYTRGIDIGKCLEYAFSANRLEIVGDMAVAFAGDQMIHSENIGNLLPISNINDIDVVNIYEGNYAKGNGVVKSIEVKNKYMVEMLLNVEEETTVVFDPAVRYFIGEAEKDESLMYGISENYRYYIGSSVNFTGEPTLVGIIKDEDAVLIGGYDGSFYELYISEDGRAMITSKTQVPSHSPILKVYEEDDKYYLEDMQGNIWKRRIGYRIPKSTESIVSEVKGRIRSAVDDSIFDMISKETVKKLGLKITPGMNGKEWE